MACGATACLRGKDSNSYGEESAVARYDHNARLLIRLCTTVFQARCSFTRGVSSRLLASAPDEACVRRRHHVRERRTKRPAVPRPRGLGLAGGITSRV